MRIPLLFLVALGILISSGCASNLQDCSAWVKIRPGGFEIGEIGFKARNHQSGAAWVKPNPGGFQICEAGIKFRNEQIYNPEEWNHEEVDADSCDVPDDVERRGLL